MRAWRCFLCIALLLAISATAWAGKDKKPKGDNAEQLRADYIAKLQQKNAPVTDERTPGSLWTPQSDLMDFSGDYKAHRLNDTVTIQISVQTNAAQSGSVNTSRAFNTNSSVTGIMGQTPAVTNPLLAAQSATTLKGSGQTASNTNFTTSLTGQVIAVLPNGNLVLEAQREVFLNNQHEHVVVRGMIRPGDIGSNNTVVSTSLSNLEIEMKGKGIISDGVKPPNFITRALLWLFGF